MSMSTDTDLSHASFLLSQLLEKARNPTSQDAGPRPGAVARSSALRAGSDDASRTTCVLMASPPAVETSRTSS